MLPPLDPKIINTLNLEGFTSEEQKEIVDKLEENIRTALLLEILNRLPESDRTELTSMSMNGSADKAKEFLQIKIPHFSDMITKTSVSVITEFNELRK